MAANLQSLITQLEGYKSNIQSALARLNISNASTLKMSQWTSALDSIPRLSSSTYTPSTSNVYIPANKFITEQQTILGDANLVASNIKSGASVFGVTGTYSGETITYIEPVKYSRRTISQYSGSEKVIMGMAFYSCGSLDTVSIPNCEFVGAQAFESCTKLVSINLDTCRAIDCSAFCKCTKLSEISLPKCELIGYHAFESCTSLYSITLNGPVSIQTCAFSGCTSLYNIQAGECTIGNYAFANCSALQYVTLSKCSYIYSSAFTLCSSLNQVRLQTCSGIEQYAFQQCSNLQQVYIPRCSSLGIGAFQDCSKLTKVVAPALTGISERTFIGCSSLATLSVAKCKSIEDFAFGQCYNLISLYLMNSSVVSLKSTYAFYSTPIGGYSSVAGQYGYVYVPASLLSSYRAATNWATYSSRILSYTAPTYNVSLSFSNCSCLTTIPETIEDTNTLELTLQASEGYEFTDVSFQINNCDFHFEADTNLLFICNITGDISGTVTASEATYPLTITTSHCSTYPTPETITYESELYLWLTVDDGYTVDSSCISSNNCTAYYDDSSFESPCIVVYSPTGAATVTVTAKAQ